VLGRWSIEASRNKSYITLRNIVACNLVACFIASYRIPRLRKSLPLIKATCAGDESVHEHRILETRDWRVEMNVFIRRRRNITRQSRQYRCLENRIRRQRVDLGRELLG